MNKYTLLLSLLFLSVCSIAQQNNKEQKAVDSMSCNVNKIASQDELQWFDIDKILNESKDTEPEYRIEESEKPFTTVEQMPSFPGGTEAMMQFISDNLVYPDSAKQAGLQGRVTVRLIVEPDGSLSDIQVLRGIDKECDKEAVRIIESMPKWIPGKQFGEEVRVYFTLLVIFRLNNEKTI